MKDFQKLKLKISKITFETICHEFQKHSDKKVSYEKNTKQEDKIIENAQKTIDIVSILDMDVEAILKKYEIK